MFDDLLVHEVQVFPRRRNSTKTDYQRDRFGQAVDINPRQHPASEQPAATYPCRTYMKSGGLTSEERSTDVFEKIYILYTSLDANIVEDDAVRVVDPNDGSQIFDKGIVKDSEVKYDSVGPHHQEFTIWIQMGPS